MPRYDFLRFAAPFRTKISISGLRYGPSREHPQTRGRHPRDAAKSRIEMREAAESRLGGNPENGRIRLHRHPTGMLHPNWFSARRRAPRPLPEIVRFAAGHDFPAVSAADIIACSVCRSGKEIRIPPTEPGFYEAAFPVLPQPGPHFRSSSSTAPDGPERRLPDGPCTDTAEARSDGRRSPPLRCEQPRGRTRMKKEGEDSPNGILPRQTPAEPT